MPMLETLHREGGLIMRSGIWYDDLAFLANATTTLQRVGSRPEVDADWTIKSWAIHTLGRPADLERSLAEAVDAHLVVIPYRHARTLPPRLLEWLDRWAALRQIEEAAVAVIDDDINLGYRRAVSPELAKCVQKHDLKLIIGEVHLAIDSTKLAVRIPQESPLALPLERPGFEYALTSDSFRGFGINE